jgi:Tfp pilus assembly protein PilF
MTEPHRLMSAAFAILLLPLAVAAQRGVDCRSFAGPYTIDGRVVMRSGVLPPFIEVRLERDAGVWEESAFTDGNGEFSFSGLDINTGAASAWFLAVGYEGYETVRQKLDWREIACNYGGMVLFLEESPDEADDADRTGPRTVDLQQLLARIPPEAEAAYDRAMAALAAGGGAEVAASLEEAVELAPNYYEALNKLGVEYLKADRLDEAEAVLIHARSLNPGDPRPLVHLGRVNHREGLALAQSGDPDLALAAYRESALLFRQAIRLDPLVGEPSFLLGLSLYELRDYASAEVALLEALALDPSLSDARLTLLNVYTRQRRYDEALAQIAAFLGASPNSPQRGAVEAIRIQIETAARQSQEPD